MGITHKKAALRSGMIKLETLLHAGLNRLRRNDQDRSDNQFKPLSVIRYYLYINS